MELNLEEIKTQLQHIIDVCIEVNLSKDIKNQKQYFDYLSYDNGEFTCNYYRDLRGEEEEWWYTMTDEEITLPLEEVIEINRLKAVENLKKDIENRRLQKELMLSMQRERDEKDFERLKKKLKK